MTMPQSEHNPISAMILSFISLGSWLLTITIHDLQVGVSIAGGLVAMISGVVSIYKNIKSK